MSKHKTDPKRRAAALRAWVTIRKNNRLKAKNAKLSKKVIAKLPATIKAAERKMPKAA